MDDSQLFKIFYIWPAQELPEFYDKSIKYIL